MGTGPNTSEIPASLSSVCRVLFVLTLCYFPIAHFAHTWIYDSNGLGIPTDFVNVWAAGKLALDGEPAQAWDWSIQKAIEVVALNKDFTGFFAWHYPPPFLFVAMFLAQFPYALAFVGWLSITVIPYLVVMRAIVGRSFGLILAIAIPATLNNIAVGQNGFLTASLVGGTLYLLPRRPVLAGICLGLLSYKPQYGLLFPLVLIATAQWKVFFSAAITAASVGAASYLAFGVESWAAFFDWLPRISQAVLTDGKDSWSRLQSVFAMVRWLGGSNELAWTFQWAVTGLVAVLLVPIWRSTARYSLKAGALAVGALLSSPYVYMYDLVLLGIPIAYLVRIGLKTGFRSYEAAALGVVLALLATILCVVEPVGLPAALIVAGLILLRASAWWRQSTSPNAIVSSALIPLAD
jgi:arabinofuranan 3-O-arabinosyltransferase